MTQRPLWPLYQDSDYYFGTTQPKAICRLAQSVEVQGKEGSELNVQGAVVRQKISRTNDYQQAGERFRTMDDWEREDLINNLVGALKECNEDIQERMVGHLTQCDQEYGRRVAEGLGRKVDELMAETAVSN